MPLENTVTKTLWQYSELLPDETIEFLKDVAADYCKVKNYVFKKYAGIQSIDKLTPVYNILNEMRVCGLREQLNLPVVYYELAVIDAVGTIKSLWSNLKLKIGGCITANENLSADDRRYLRTVLKLNHVYAAVLNRTEYEMPKNAEGLDIDVKRLNNLLCRLTRRYLKRPESDCMDYFRISPNGYSYKDGAMRIVCRTPRKRISIPLKDSRQFDRQIQIHIREGYVALAVPVEAKIRKHGGYTQTVCIHIGRTDMFTLSNGHIYGRALNEITDPETERLDRKNRERRKAYVAYRQSVENGNMRKAQEIKENNLGKRKYDRQKEQMREGTKTFINSEINKMIETEKPVRIVIAAPVTKNKTKIYAKETNRKLARSFNGYIRERLKYKCRVNSIELVEINSKGTGAKCSVCGAEGKRRDGGFICESCGSHTTIAYNCAKNIEQKYVEQHET